MRKIVDGKDYRMPATIEDPAVLEEIAAIADERRIGQRQRRMEGRT
jgi:propionyl-CoA synthetase